MEADFDRSLAHQALLVYTDPLCCYALDLVAEGETSVSSVARRVAERLDVDVARAEAVLDGLVGIGYVDRTGLGRIRAVSRARQFATITASVDYLVVLREEGDPQQAADCAEAMSAAWDARSSDPRLRRLAAQFHESEAGRRHAKRIADGTLGTPDRTESDRLAIESVRRKAVVALTRPSCLIILERLTSGSADSRTLVALVHEELGIPRGYARESLDWLVRLGWITPVGRKGTDFGRLDPGFVPDRIREAQELRDDLLQLGDLAQAEVIDAALTASWDARAADPDRRAAARAFIHSAKGEAFQVLLADRTLGAPFAMGKSSAEATTEHDPGREEADAPTADPEPAEVAGT